MNKWELNVDLGWRELLEDSLEVYTLWSSCSLLIKDPGITDGDEVRRSAGVALSTG